MAVPNSRENTFKVDLSNFPKRPSYEAIHRFVHRTIGLQIHQVKRMQINHALKCAHVKCIDLKTAQDAVEKHNGRHELEVEDGKFRVRLAIDNGCTEVRIHDLSEIVTNEEIASFLRHYGDVHDIRELTWSGNFDLQSVPSGVRVVTMTLRTHIKSFVTIRDEPTLVTYRGQPQTCRHCTQLMHPGSTCVENRKQLKSVAENTETSFASVLKEAPAPQPSPPASSSGTVKKSNCTDGSRKIRAKQQQQQQQQQEKRSAKQSTTSIDSPPRKKKVSTERGSVAPSSIPLALPASAVETTATPVESTTDSSDDMETVCSDDEPEPNPHEDLGKWLEWFRKSSKAPL